MISLHHTGLQGRLASAARTEINSALSGRGTSTSGTVVAKPTSEPTAVASVLLVGVPQIAATWKPLLAKHSLSVTMHGVFCHGTPQVRFTDSSGAPKRCELSDLLVVVDDSTSGSSPDRRATLVQAKLASPASHITIGSGTDADQLDLLRNWHQFQFVSAAYNTAKRDFTAASQPGHWYESGQYGGIELSPPSWLQAAPGPSPMSLGSSLGSVLAAMVFGLDGRQTSIVAAPGPGSAPLGADDWSATIAELLATTFNRSFGLVASVGSARPHRGVTARAMYGSPTGGAASTFGPDGGISTVYVHIGRARDEG